MSDGGETPLQVDEPMSAFDCSTCSGLPYPIGFWCLPVASKAVSTSWDGHYWQQGSCGANIPCWSLVVAPAGSYVATMCSSASAQSPNPPPSSCATVPFTYPGPSPVVGTVM